MVEDYHIDMSGKIFEKKTVGIACMGGQTKKHNGCALKGNMIKLIIKELCIGSIAEEYAKLYAICIFLLIKENLADIKTLIICKDENFDYVKEYLIFLLETTTPPFKIISLAEFKRIFGRNIKSPADNLAESYRRRALNRNKWHKGTQLNVVVVEYSLIEEYWEKLEKIGKN